MSRLVRQRLLRPDEGRFGRTVYGVIGSPRAALWPGWGGMPSRGPTPHVVDGLREASGFSPGRFAELLPDTMGAIAADRVQAAGRAASIVQADAVEAVGLDDPL